MSIHRLFETTYLLLARGSMTAGELARHFEVSTRTVYRDIDTLSQAGIPVYTDQGRGGGIRLLPEFTLQKSLLSAPEKEQIIHALQSLQALKVPDTDSALAKLAALFGSAQDSWLAVDFSGWGEDETWQQVFQSVRQAILQRRIITFVYYAAGSEGERRAAEPVRILFKGQAWYVQAYCRARSAWRFFKLKRMRQVQLEKEHFTRKTPPPAPEETPPVRRVPVRLRFASDMGFRVYDDFPVEWVSREADGAFVVRGEYPDGPWLSEFLLSYGAKVKVLAPDWLRSQLAQAVGEITRLYRK